MKNTSSKPDILMDINSNLKKLLAVTAIQGMDNEKKLSILYSMGYSGQEMSELTGIPAGTIRGKWNLISKKKK